MNSNHKFTKNVVLITFTNFVRFLANIAVTLIIPIVFGKTDYGNYKTYTLYLSYLVIFNFGFIEGIYLKYGGQDYESLDKNKFRTYTKYLFIIEFFVTIIALILTAAIFKGDNRIVFLYLSLNILSIQFTTYFQRISQITSRFSKQGIFDLLYSILILVIVAITYFLKISSFKPYLFMVTIMNYLLLIWYIINYKDIIVGKSSGLKNEKNEIIKLMSLGIPLMIANFSSEFILNMDKQVVNIFFSKDDYAVYAFAYNFLNVINVLIQAISLVLYPFLKKMNPENLKNNYADSLSLMMIIVYFSLASYFPIEIIVRVFLTDYIESLSILKIIFPISVFTSCITVIKHNYYKALDKNNVYVIKTIIMLIISLLLNILFYFIFKNMSSISVASILAMIIWYIDTEIYFIKHYKVHYVKNISYLLLMLGIYFLCVFLIKNIYISFAIYLFLTLLFSLIFFHNLIISTLKSFFGKRKMNDYN